MTTGGLESVGGVVTGGLAARAVEPGAGEGEGKGEGHGACLNCGTALAGPHCHQCGQAAHVHRTLTAFWHDLAHSVLHFDGKLWRTLPLLALRPGELTRRYVAGQRASFVSPMALFLFSVFLMFAVFSTIGGPVGGSGDTQQSRKAEADFARESGALERQIAALERRRAALAAGRLSTDLVDARLRTLRHELQGLQAVRSVVIVPSSAPGAPKKTVDLSGSGLMTPWPWLNHGIEKARQNPSLLLYKLQTNAYKFSWALIPISVPFLWLLFLHRRRYRAYRAYDHTVFITYSIAFMSLGVIALSALRLLGAPDVIAGFAILFVPPIHMYRQLRGAYDLLRWSALWRTFVLIVFAFIAAMLFFTGLLALGVLG
ncbi:MAG TPA: DUF3667 domain-containing protein [Allosphingosinicella sp.]|jgi:hypothetical protein